MTDQVTDRNSNDLFTDESTQSRWNWVHKAISLAKTKNKTQLLSSEAPDACATAEVQSAGR